MALICMACFDTVENGRTSYTAQTLQGLLQTVNFYQHRLAIIDNGSCQATLDELKSFADRFPNKENLILIYNHENLGTARAINKGLLHRKAEENVIKMDNDCVIGSVGWVDEMEECIIREPKIGIVGLKRMDLQNSPNNKDVYYKSELIMLPHQRGERWIIVEKVSHIIGTCEMLSAALIHKIGGFEQPTIYGYDDTIVFYKSNLLKFLNVYLPHIVIHHLDIGGTEHTNWKIQHSKESRKEFESILVDLKKGRRPIYYAIHQPAAPVPH